jgi:serine/threonine protein kinase
MSSTSRADRLLELVRKSNLVEGEALDAFIAAGPLSSSAREVARALVRANLLTTYQAQQLLAGKHRGFFLGAYKVLQPIGKGAMGAVYLAEHIALRRRVALKFLPNDLAEDKPALQRFNREARAVAALDHPNIIRAYDVCDYGSLHFIVLEYVEGETLDEMVRRGGQLAIDQAVNYILQAVGALEHAGARGVVHRDIKPSNLFVTREGQVKVLDMGLARFFRDPNDDLTRKLGGAVLGTADYIAPEQALSSEVDIRADLYSLGATLYTLLSGAPPFRGKTTSQKLLAHQLKVAEPIHKVRPEVPVDLSRIIDQMMAKDVEARYQTPTEVREALEAFLADRSASAKHPGKARRPRPSARRCATDGLSAHVREQTRAARPPLAPRETAPSQSRWPLVVAGLILTLLAASSGWMLHAGHHLVLSPQPAAAARTSEPGPGTALP